MYHYTLFCLHISRLFIWNINLDQRGLKLVFLYQKILLFVAKKILRNVEALGQGGCLSLVAEVKQWEIENPSGKESPLALDGHQPLAAVSDFGSLKLMKIHKRARPPDTNASWARREHLEFCKCKKAIGSDPEQSGSKRGCGSQNSYEGAETLHLRRSIKT